MEMAPSSSTSESYPIEIGVACWTAPGASITTWSTPVDPSQTADWGEPQPLFLEHVGLELRQLRSGMTPSQIAQQLNDIFMTATVYGRGGTVDVHLANRLNLAARVWPTYSLKTWRDICERHAARGANAWDIIRAAQGDAAQRALGTMRGIAHLLGQNPACRSVPTMAVSLPI